LGKKKKGVFLWRAWGKKRKRDCRRSKKKTFGFPPVRKKEKRAGRRKGGAQGEEVFEKKRGGKCRAKQKVRTTNLKREGRRRTVPHIGSDEKKKRGLALKGGKKKRRGGGKYTKS